MGWGLKWQVRIRYSASNSGVECNEKIGILIKIKDFTYFNPFFAQNAIFSSTFHTIIYCIIPSSGVVYSDIA